MKSLASILMLGVTAFVLTGCCCDTYDNCEPCAKPCAKPCEKPCDPCHKPANSCHMNSCNK